MTFIGEPCPTKSTGIFFVFDDASAFLFVVTVLPPLLLDAPLFAI
jgi:hypothetical protein